MVDPTSDSFNVKKTEGQRAVQMNRIENKTALVTTFCKRRMGLFKKASELCTLCAVQMALIVFSPTAKPYAFGQPNVDSIMHEYLARNVKDLPRVRNGATVEKLCEELAQVKKEMKLSAKSGDELEKIRNANKKKSWWNKSTEYMNLSELEECKKVIEEVMAIVSVCTGSGSGSGSTDGVDLNLALRP